MAVEVSRHVTDSQRPIGIAFPSMYEATRSRGCFEARRPLPMVGKNLFSRKIRQIGRIEGDVGIDRGHVRVGLQRLLVQPDRAAMVGAGASTSGERDQ